MHQSSTPLPTLRDAIAMIELIFAIVIMGIVLMSAPMLISNATKSNITAFQQESIAIAASHTNAIMSYAWDPSNVAFDTDTRILTTTQGDTNLDQSAVNPRLRGNNANISRTRLFLAGSAATAIPAGGGVPLDDINDFNGNVRGLNLYTAAANQSQVGEYIDQNITIATLVAYDSDAATNYNAINVFTYNFTPNDAGAVPTTNIKHIRTRLTSNSPDVEIANKTIILRAFMCNIGAASPDTRDSI